MSNQVEPNSVSYWEDRTINIGDYESRKMGVSITLKTVDINFLDKKALISAQETVKIYPHMSMEDALNKAVKIVERKLDEREKFIRELTNDFVSDLVQEKAARLFNIKKPEDDIQDFEEDKPKRKATKKFKEEDVDFDDFDNEDNIEDDFEEANFGKGKGLVNKKKTRKK